MSIGNVVQRGLIIFIYDENNRQKTSIPVGSGPKDGLLGYTPSRVNVRRGGYVYSYDERGAQVSCVPA